MQGIVKLMNSAPAEKGAVFFVIHRAELRAVGLDGHTVTWVTSSGDFEAEFYLNEDRSPAIATLFFNDLVSETENSMWENSTVEEKWLHNGVEVTP